MAKPTAETKRRRAAKARAALIPVEHGAKSVCVCGHSGDGAFGQHGGAIGHGPCTQCACSKFTWARFIGEFTADR